MFSSFNGVRRFTPLVTGLYPFTSHVFTNCSVTGRFGPSLAQMQAAYSGISWAQNTEFLNQGTYQGYQKWTVPVTGLYRITAIGAAGGASSAYPPSYFGRGVQAQADIALFQGEFLIIVVGQAGTTAPYFGGGGGGTFVVRFIDGSPLVVAGGGGGARQNQNYRTVNSDASVTTNAKPYSNYPDNRGCPGAGGFSGDGMNSQTNGAGAGGYPSGLIGCSSPSGDAGAGGFGGGSCGDSITGEELAMGVAIRVLYITPMVQTELVVVVLPMLEQVAVLMPLVPTL
ncbi:hypothetical protein MASR1M31_19420 [Porphyromonadaceae bacterium]